MRTAENGHHNLKKRSGNDDAYALLSTFKRLARRSRRNHLLFEAPSCLLVPDLETRCIGKLTGWPATLKSLIKKFLRKWGLYKVSLYVNS